MVKLTGKFIGLLLLFGLLFNSGSAAAHDPALHAADKAFDQQFLGKMIPHHQMAIDMATDCVAKATHEELKGLCRQIATKQKEESGKMRSWLNAWYKGDAGHGPSQAMMKQSQQMMEKLKTLSGAEYEVRFMNEMSKHHKQALQDTKPCTERASHAELKSLCTTMTQDQQREVEQMHTWLCSWHKDCHGAADH